MAKKISAIERSRIYEEEKIRTEARIKATFRSKTFYIYLICVAVLSGSLVFFFGRSSGESKLSLVALDNEIRINTAILEPASIKYKIELGKSSSTRTYVEVYLQREILGSSLTWYPGRFSAIDVHDRMDLLKKDVSVLQVNELVKQLADPTSKSSDATWKAALQDELSAIDDYDSAAEKIEGALDKLLGDTKASDNLRVK